VLPDLNAVLFDLGGTLVDYPLPSLPVAVGRFARGVYGFLVRPESDLAPRVADVSHAREVRRRPVPRGTALLHRATIALRRIIRSASADTLPRMAEAGARPLMAEGRLFDDALPTLLTLRERGYRLGIVSNTPWGTPGYLWESQLDRFHLSEPFDVRLFSSAIGFSKPDPRIFREALDRLGASPGRTLFIGDRPRTDIAGARRAGLRTALLLRPGQPRFRSRAAPDLCISSLAELLRHLPGPAKNVDTPVARP
jgi:putative hydrolase of the HAD superfamily